MRLLGSVSKQRGVTFMCVAAAFFCAKLSFCTSKPTKLCVAAIQLLFFYKLTINDDSRSKLCV